MANNTTPLTVYSDFMQFYGETVQLLRNRAEKASELLSHFEGDSWTDSACFMAEAAVSDLSCAVVGLERALDDVNRVLGNRL